MHMDDAFANESSTFLRYNPNYKSVEKKVIVPKMSKSHIRKNRRKPFAKKKYRP